MLDDNIIYEERYDARHRMRALRRMLLFCLYFFLFFVLAASVAYGFYQDDAYRKESIWLQMLLVPVGLSFVWGMVHCAIRVLWYFREFAYPVLHLYKRNIVRVEQLSTEKPHSIEFLLFEIKKRTSGQIFHLDQPIGKIKELYSWKIGLKGLQIKTPIAIEIAVGAYSQRVWTVTFDVDN